MNSKKNKKIFQSKKGFSLVEIIIYVALLAVFVGAITWSMGIIFHSFYKMRDTRQVENSAMISMDKMIHEIRNSKYVDLANTATSTPNGYLTLNNVDSSGNPETIKFYLLNNRIYVDQNGVGLGPLTLENTAVNSLVFRYFTSASSTGVKIEMAMQASSTPINYFYDSAVLRSSYEN